METLSGAGNRLPLALRQAGSKLRSNPKRWLVTGSAGFIGSHLVEALLRLGQSVVSIDNFETGHRSNLEAVRAAVGDAVWRQHEFIEADIADADACRRVCEGAHVVLHQAALGSVPRSISEPLRAHEVNTTGFLNILVAARDARVERFVYASSSAVYGDAPALPKVEGQTGHPLSPYALTKCVDEMYADVFARCFGMASIGLRYFNVFGPRQDPNGPYAAVVPRWVEAMLQGKPIVIYGDGETTRDFCYIANVVQANLLAATSDNPQAIGQVYNVAVGGRMSLNGLYGLLRSLILERHAGCSIRDPIYESFRPGDIRDSQADIGRACSLLGYDPTHDVRTGLRETLPAYEASIREPGGARRGKAKRANGLPPSE